jgi:hypothetical protein
LHSNPYYVHGPRMVFVADVHAIQLVCLKSLPRAFTDSTGIKANFDKYHLIPIKIDNGKYSYRCKNSGMPNCSYAINFPFLPFF